MTKRELEALREAYRREGKLEKRIAALEARSSSPPAVPPTAAAVSNGHDETLTIPGNVANSIVGQLTTLIEKVASMTERFEKILGPEEELRAAREVRELWNGMSNEERFMLSLRRSHANPYPRQR